MDQLRHGDSEEWGLPEEVKLGQGHRSGNINVSHARLLSVLIGGSVYYDTFLSAMTVLLTNLM